MEAEAAHASREAQQVSDRAHSATREAARQVSEASTRAAAALSRAEQAEAAAASMQQAAMAVEAAAEARAVEAERRASEAEQRAHEAAEREVEAREALEAQTMERGVIELRTAHHISNEQKRFNELMAEARRREQEMSKTAAELHQQLQAQRAHEAAAAKAQARVLLVDLMRTDAELGALRETAMAATRAAGEAERKLAEREAALLSERDALVRKGTAEGEEMRQRLKHEAAAAIAASARACAAREAAGLAEHEERTRRVEEGTAYLVRELEERLSGVSAELARIQGDAHAGAHYGAGDRWRGSGAPPESNARRSEHLHAESSPSLPEAITWLLEKLSPQAPSTPQSSQPLHPQHVWRYEPPPTPPPPTLPLPAASPSIAAIEAAADAQASEFASRLSAVQQNLSSCHLTRLEATRKLHAAQAHVLETTLELELRESEGAAAAADEAYRAISAELVGAQNETHLSVYVMAHELNAAEKQLGAIRLKLSLAEKRAAAAEKRAHEAAAEAALHARRADGEALERERAATARAEAEASWRVARHALEEALETARSTSAGAEANWQLSRRDAQARAAEVRETLDGSS